MLTYQILEGSKIDLSLTCYKCYLDIGTMTIEVSSILTLTMLTNFRWSGELNQHFLDIINKLVKGLIVDSVGNWSFDNL